MRQSIFKKTIYGLAMTLLLRPIGAACGQHPVSELIYGDLGTLETFDPYISQTPTAERLAGLIFDSLLEAEPDGGYQPRLARAWEISADRSVVIVTLREDVLWHRSSSEATSRFKLTPEDVVSTVRLLTDMPRQFSGYSRYTNLKRAEKVSAHSVKVYLKQHAADPLASLTFKVLPAHLLHKDRDFKKYGQFARHPVGTGPYRFIEADPQGEVHLAANSDYFAGPPQIQRLTMKPYTNRRLLTEALTFASVDLIATIDPEKLGELQENPRLGVLSYDAGTLALLTINTQRGVLKDRRVRQAIAHAINRRDMLRAFFQDKGKVVEGPFPPNSWVYSDPAKVLDFDPEKAKSLLSEVGLDQVARAPLRLLLQVGPDSETDKKVGMALQGYLEHVGLNVELQLLSPSSWRNRVLVEHNYDLTLVSSPFVEAGHLNNLALSQKMRFSVQDLGLFRGGFGHRFSETERDKQRLGELYHELQTVLRDELPCVYLWALKGHAAFNERLLGVRLGTGGFFKNIVVWRLAPEREMSHGAN